MNFNMNFHQKMADKWNLQLTKKNYGRWRPDVIYICSIAPHAQ